MAASKHEETEGKEKTTTTSVKNDGLRRRPLGFKFKCVHGESHRVDRGGSLGCASVCGRSTTDRGRCVAQPWPRTQG